MLPQIVPNSSNHKSSSRETAADNPHSVTGAHKPCLWREGAPNCRRLQGPIKQQEIPRLTQCKIAALAPPIQRQSMCIRMYTAARPSFLCREDKKSKGLIKRS